MEKINKRIEELKREVQIHQQRANQAQQLLSTETQQIVAKQGAILELRKLLDEKPEIEKTKKIERNKKGKV